MANNNQKKNFLDPATLGSIGLFVLRSSLHSIVGWISLNLFLRWRDKFWKKRPVESNQPVSGEEPPAEG